MSFVRPEVADRLRRWREPAASIGVLLAGLWLIWRALGGNWLLWAPGLLATMAGAGWLVGAVYRLRLRAAEPGEGIVAVDEGRIGYLGPRTGGYVDVPDLVRIEVTPTAWVLVADGAEPLVIPRGAPGAEKLPDALNALPGFDLAAAARARGPALVWHRGRAVAVPARLGSSENE